MDENLLFAHLAQAIEAAKSKEDIAFTCGLLEMARLLRALPEEEAAALQEQIENKVE